MKRNRSVENIDKRRPTGAAVMQPALTDALTRALFVEWAETGYAALSLERVAARAGVGKAALYRRWPSKAAMVSDRLAAVGVELTDVPDTGSLAGDVRAALLSLRRVLRHPLIRRILLDLHAELNRTPELATAIRPFQAARRARVATLLDRAVARGELAVATDHDMAADLLGAPLYWRMAVAEGQADSAYLDRLTEVVCAGLRATSVSGELGPAMMGKVSGASRSHSPHHTSGRA